MDQEYIDPLCDEVDYQMPPVDIPAKVEKHDHKRKNKARAAVSVPGASEPTPSAPAEPVPAPAPTPDDSVPAPVSESSPLTWALNVYEEVWPPAKKAVVESPLGPSKTLLLAGAGLLVLGLYLRSKEERP